MAEEKKMSLIQKVIRIRKEFTGLRIEKSGNGPKYDYFQLEDFIPKATDLCEQYGVLPVISFASDSAAMTIYDTDSPDTLVITCPMAESKLLNCQPVQNLGASITYLRRYLWMQPASAEGYGSSAECSSEGSPSCRRSTGECIRSKGYLE